MMTAEEGKHTFPPSFFQPEKGTRNIESNINLVPENSELWSEIKRLLREEKGGEMLLWSWRMEKRNDSNFFLRDGFLRKAIVRNGLTYDRLCVPEIYRPRILATFHDEMASGAHIGITRTYDSISRRFYWVGLQTDVIEYVGSCPHCQSRKRSYAPPAGKMVCVRVEKPLTAGSVPSFA